MSRGVADAQGVWIILSVAATTLAVRRVGGTVLWRQAEARSCRAFPEHSKFCAFIPTDMGVPWRDVIWFQGQKLRACGSRAGQRC